MTETQRTPSASPETNAAAERWTKRWLFPLLRVLLLVFAAWLVWYTAGHWDRWTGPRGSNRPTTPSCLAT